VRFSVDPWDPAYGTSLDTELGASTAEVDVDVERPADRWQPLDPPAGVAPPATVRFVDGVRRVDAQVWVDERDGTASPALCASYAAGVVCCCADGGAHLIDARVLRGLFTTAADGTDIVTVAGTYAATRTSPHPARPPMQILSQALQNSLTAAELTVALRIEGGPDDAADLTVLDGPLPAQPVPRAIGFIKSHRDTYLPAALGGIVAALRSGQRTPVFRLRRSLGRPWQRYSWYLRLPAAAGAPWAGVVRVECGPDLDAERAITLAGLSQVTLVRFASTEYKDHRAQQNLYPIAGLERALRRRLGEPTVLYRALRRAAAA
jgi:hypothetical protein